MRPLLLICLIAISVSFYGCLRSITTVLVRKDGSAVVTDSLMLGKSAVQMWQEMAKASKTSLEKLIREQWNDSVFYSAAPKMGPGVTVRSVKFVKGAKGAGYVSVYDVKDIGTLSINKNAFSEHMQTTDSGKPHTPSYVRFIRSGAAITVHNMPLTPEPESDTGAVQSDEEIKQQLEILKKFMGDFELGFRIRVEPGIASSDASFVQKNVVTIMDLPFKKVINQMEQQPDIFRFMKGNKDSSPWSLERAFNSLGTSVKMETKETIRIVMKQ